jgi:hypothetical protein
MKKYTFLALTVALLTSVSQANPADFDNNEAVDFIDLAIFVAAWLSNDTPTANWNPACDISDPADGVVNGKDFCVLAANWLWWLPPEPPDGMVFVYINDPGVDDNGDGTPDHEPFDGEMSKYETTNAQYCQFLNDALATGDIFVDGSFVRGANGSNRGADWFYQQYYYLDGTGVTVDGATNGGAARINYNEGVFTVDSGFEDHPVTWVSWWGPSAFCNYYGLRLPTEWEWQAVADYDGSFIYGCGTTINNSIANYYNSTHPDGTTIVGSFGTYGYGMCDMSGNVWEWTDSVWEPGYSSHVLRGGGWPGVPETVSERATYYDGLAFYMMGFRACR